MFFKAHYSSSFVVPKYLTPWHRRFHVPGATSTAWRFLSIYTRPGVEQMSYLCYPKDPVMSKDFGISPTILWPGDGI